MIIRIVIAAHEIRIALTHPSDDETAAHFDAAALTDAAENL